MKKLYSKCDPEKLLQIIVYRRDMVGNDRTNYCDEKEILQLSSMSMLPGKRYRAHQHVKQNKLNGVCQESWVVIEGSVRCYLYDLNKTLLYVEILNVGDCVITLQGGHGYECLTERSLVYEFKTGPYLGGDKIFLEEKNE